MTTVNLKIREEDTVKTVPFEIEDLTGQGFINLTTVVNKLMVEAKENEGLKGLLTQLFNDGAGEKKDIKDVDLNDLTSTVLNNAVGSFEVLFVTVPERAFDLLAALSEIDVAILKKQKFETILDIYDAVLEKNDLEKLVKRLKKSLALTQAKMAFMKAARKATGAETVAQ